jgi:hypothetical protein
MESTIGPVSTAILLFVAFVVPFVIIVLDDKASHQA